MKKGLAPLISWILIISFSIAIAMLVIPVFVNKASDISDNLISNNNQVDYCNDVSLSVDSLCKQDAALEFKINNNGDYSVYGVSVGRVTNVSTLGWCKYNNTILPGVGVDFVFNLVSDYNVLDAKVQDLEICNDSHSPGNQIDAVKLELVPWIKPDPEGDIIYCEDRKITIDNFNYLNNPCVPYCTDDDNDGFIFEVSGTCDASIINPYNGDQDCDDNNANVYPGALERCGNNVDDDCDGVDASCGYCTRGDPIPSSGCICAGRVYYGGYCCNNGYSPDPCGGINPGNP